MGLRMAAVVVLGCMIIGCSNMPKVTRTGDVKDVMIGETLEPAERAAAAGDEVRWINKRTAPVRIVFLDPVDEAFSCNNGFGGWMAKSGTASLDPNETASVCFRQPGFYRYTVRMKAASPTGEINASGVVRVGNVGAHGRGPME
jgi:plastocyanin